MHIVLSSVAIQISREATREGKEVPKFVYGDNPTQTDGLPLLILTEPEGEMIATNSSGFEIDQLALLILVHRSENEANQMAQDITKYIGQNKMSLPLINSKGGTIGHKNIDRLSIRPMSNESGQRFGVAIVVEWTDRKLYPEIEAPLVGEININAQEE